ncbi:MAG: serine/threonine-protein phosphatase [Planctomycetaceae bacterium]|nr:serine/threonine-protein phosphatase [Planctomycetaceae bacterium]
MASILELSASDDPTADFPTIPQRRARMHVDTAGGTHRGRVRKRNEDQFLIAKLAKSMRICASSLPESETTRFADEVGYLMIVADGMGGNAGGVEASSIAVRTVESYVLNAVKWFLHGQGLEQDAVRSKLRLALQRADSDILTRAEGESELSGMGTTLTMTYSVGTDLFVAHVGDSRAYLFRSGRLECITSDHTLVQLLVNAGAIAPEEARDHPRRHVITNVVGGPNPGVEVEIHHRELENGDIVLLCTDGLTEDVGEPEIARILAQSQDLDRSAHQLIDTALAGRARDNITVALAKYTIT